MGALSGLRTAQRQVNETLRHIDPNTTDPLANKARRDARQIQAEVQQKAADIAGALRQSSLDLEA
jgi:hypothetical protein